MTLLPALVSEDALGLTSRNPLHWLCQDPKADFCYDLIINHHFSLCFHRNASCLILDFLNHRLTFENTSVSPPPEMSLMELTCGQDEAEFNEMEQFTAQLFIGRTSREVPEGGQVL